MFKLARQLLFGGLIGKAVGIGREVFAAWTFGTGIVASSFRAAFAVFSLPLHALVSETVSSAFVPIFSRTWRTDKEGAGQLFATVHTTLLVISSVVGTALVLFSAPSIRFLATGFDEAQVSLAASMLSILAISAPFYFCTTLYSAVDLSLGSGRFTSYRASVQSFGLIAGTAVAYLANEPRYIPLGFLAAYTYLAFRGSQIATTAGLRLFALPRATTLQQRSMKDFIGAFRVLALVPIFIQINTYIERKTATEVHAGAIAALDYARIIADTSIVLLAVPFASAGLAAMANMNDSEYRASAMRSFRILLYAGIPISAIGATNATFLVETIFQRGAFSQESTAVTSSIFAGLSVGIFAQLVTFTGAKFLNARGANRRIMPIAALSTALGATINLSCAGTFGAATLGIASAAYNLCFGALVLLQTGLFRALLKEITGLVTMCVGQVAFSLTAGRSLGPFLHLVACAAIWAVFVFFCGPFEFSEFAKNLYSRKADKR